MLAVLLELIYNLCVKSGINYGHHDDIGTQRTSGIQADVLQKPFVNCFPDIISQLLGSKLFFASPRSLFDLGKYILFFSMLFLKEYDDNYIFSESECRQQIPQE